MKASWLIVSINNTGTKTDLVLPNRTGPFIWKSSSSWALHDGWVGNDIAIGITIFLGVDNSPFWSPNVADDVFYEVDHDNFGYSWFSFGWSVLSLSPNLIPKANYFRSYNLDLYCKSTGGISWIISRFILLCKAWGAYSQSPLASPVDDISLDVYWLPEAALSKYFPCPTIINYHFT